MLDSRPTLDAIALGTRGFGRVGRGLGGFGRVKSFFFPGPVGLTSQTVARRESSNLTLFCLISMQYALGKVVPDRSKSIQVVGLFSFAFACLGS